MEFGKVIKLESKSTGHVCPLCGSNIIAEDFFNKEIDYERCSNDNCKWFSSQFLSYEDTIQYSLSVVGVNSPPDDDLSGGRNSTTNYLLLISSTVNSRHGQNNSV